MITLCVYIFLYPAPNISEKIVASTIAESSQRFINENKTMGKLTCMARNQYGCFHA